MSASRLPFSKIARSILPGWEVSLAFVDATTAQSLNRRLRGASYVPNVLSYVVGSRHGEVIICKAVARKEASEFGLSEREFTLLLFIHALLHLKGGRHGSTMERREWALLGKHQGGLPRPLTHNGSTHRNRHRHRHLPGQNGRRRRARR